MHKACPIRVRHAVCAGRVNPALYGFLIGVHRPQHQAQARRDRNGATQQENQQQGYMERASPFSMDEAPRQIAASETSRAETAFMDHFPPSNTSLTFINSSNQLESIPNINLRVVAERSPLLAAAFEQARGRCLLHLETLTSLTAIPFLRFLYTGYYLSCQCEPSSSSSALTCAPTPSSQWRVLFLQPLLVES